MTARGMPALAALLVLAWLPGCGDDPATDGANFVRIVSMEPPLSETLLSGSRVDFEIAVRYSLAEESGTITLVIQRAEPGFPPLAREIGIVRGGAGQLTLHASVEIPRTTSLQVSTPLSPHAGKRSSVVDSRVYKVDPGVDRPPGTLLQTRTGKTAVAT